MAEQASPNAITAISVKGFKSFAKEQRIEIYPLTLHLLEAALQADHIVISRDETVRGLFRRCCPAINEIRNVLWANPEIETEEVVSWLREGARVEAERRLGAPAR